MPVVDMKAVTLLLVEDDDTTREELGEVTAREGFDVRLASNGLEGWASYQLESSEIVVADLKMPGLDGLQLMSKIKGVAPDAPMILITAFGETDTAIDALRAGALDYFKKPVDLDELLDALGRAKEVALKNRHDKHYPSLLLAEDESITRRHLAEVLEKEGWHVLAAAHGREAVELFEQHAVDVVLLDVKMPQLSGLDALAIMRRHRRDFEAVVLTGYGDEQIAIQALRNGVSGFLRKPVDLDELLAVLDKARERLVLRRALRHRTREVLLAEQIIAQLSEDRELAFYLPPRALEDACAKGEGVLERLSDAAMVLDHDRSVLFRNSAMVNALGEGTDQIDDAALTSLAERSNGALTLESAQECLAAAAHGAVGVIHGAGSEEGVGMTCVRIRVRYEVAAQDYLLLLVHGLVAAGSLSVG